MRKKGQWNQRIVPLCEYRTHWAETIRERVGKFCDGAHGFRSAVRCIRPEVGSTRRRFRSCKQRACELCSTSDVGVPSRAAFWKATCLDETFEATVRASVRQYSDNGEPKYQGNRGPFPRRTAQETPRVSAESRCGSQPNFCVGT